jgi:hypothetical protein
LARLTTVLSEAEETEETRAAAGASGPHTWGRMSLAAGNCFRGIAHSMVAHRPGPENGVRGVSTWFRAIDRLGRRGTDGGWSPEVSDPRMEIRRSELPAAGGRCFEARPEAQPVGAGALDRCLEGLQDAREGKDSGKLNFRKC